MRKKGISPLIGTVLLIGFTIGLAILIFSWGTKFTTNLTEKTGEKAESQIACIQDIKADLSAGSFDAAARTVKYSIENRGNEAINEYNVGLTRTDGTRIPKLQTSALALYGKRVDSINLTTTEVPAGQLITKVELLSIKTPTTTCSDINEELII